VLHQIWYCVNGCTVRRNRSNPKIEERWGPPPYGTWERGTRSYVSAPRYRAEFGRSNGRLRALVDPPEKFDPSKSQGHNRHG